ncbi:ABC transporter permease [Verrucomicrobia bacterium]|nr:ABC transporter permease [Verrucomicrobiota bacterium]
MKKFLSNYGMMVVLLALCVMFSLLTLKKEGATGSSSAKRIVSEVMDQTDVGDSVFVVGAAKNDSETFANLVAEGLREEGLASLKEIIGTPRDLRMAWDASKEEGEQPGIMVVSGSVIKWTVIASLKEESPALKVLVPTEQLVSGFLKRTNLLAIVDRIVVIAVIAIGMTLVILTGGIDLSVGSLIALSAVIGTLVMKTMGGLEASWWVVWFGFLVATLSCGVIGGLGGFLVAQFKVAPFITTLAVMMVTRGVAFMVTGGFSIYQVPESLVWLGQGASFGIPNTVIVLVVFYTGAHIFMSHSRFGRYIYAVGGNEEAARLSGVPVKGVLIFVYMIGGLCAGFGGCIQASQLASGAPNLGMMFELYVIAAVVVGGTSLSGGSGKIGGTLIGAFIISVIQNGMNILGFGSYLQQVVLGAVILFAVLLDKARRGGGLKFFKN